MPPEGYASAVAGCGQAPNAPEKPLVVNFDRVAGCNVRTTGLTSSAIEFPVSLIEEMYRELQQRRDKEIREAKRQAAERRDQETVSIYVPRALARRVKDYFGQRGSRDFRGTELSVDNDSYVLYAAAKKAIA